MAKLKLESVEFDRKLTKGKAFFRYVGISRDDIEAYRTTCTCQTLEPMEEGIVCTFRVNNEDKGRKIKKLIGYLYLKDDKKPLYVKNHKGVTIYNPERKFEKIYIETEVPASVVG